MLRTLMQVAAFATAISFVIPVAMPASFSTADAQEMMKKKKMHKKKMQKKKKQMRSLPDPRKGNR